MASKNLAKYPFDEKDGKKNLEDICSMHGWSDRNAILTSFSQHNLTAQHTKFLICQQGCTNRCSLAAGLRGNEERMRK